MVVAASSQMFEHEPETLAGEVGLGMLMHCRASFLLEEPLTQILLVSWFGPAVIVDVEHLFLRLSFLLRWGWRLLLAFGQFGLLRGGRALQLKRLIMRLGRLGPPNGQIANGSDILFNPVEIFTDEVLLLLAVVADEHIAVRSGSNDVCHLLE